MDSGTKTLEDTNLTAQPRHLQILLFDAERAWAHSQLLKASLSLPGTPTATRHHLIRRLSRAVLRADSLFSLVTALGSRVSAADRGQAAAYFLVLKGSLAFEQKKHREGLNALSVAHQLLATLAATAPTAHEEALANEMIDEIEPMLRFCAYSLQLDISRGTATLIQETATNEQGNLIKGYNELVAELEEGQGKEKREAVELSWRGKTIPIRNAQLVGVVRKVKDALATLVADRNVASGQSRKPKKGAARKEVMGARRMGTYDKALLILSEGEDVARQLVEDNKIGLSKAHSARSEAASAPLQLAHSYIVYQLLAIRIKRDLLLLGDTESKLKAREAKIADRERDFVATNGTKDPNKADVKVRKQRARVYPGLVKIYDGVLQSLEQMRELDVVEEDGELGVAVEARIAFIKALRSQSLSRTYVLLDEYPFSLSLNSRAKLYAREARSLASSLDLENSANDFEEPDFAGELLPLETPSFDALDASLFADYDLFSKRWCEVSGANVNAAEPEDLSLAELNLDGLVNTVRKTKKPEFYDVAYSYVVAFDMEALARKAGLRGAMVEEVEDIKKVEVEPTANNKMAVDKAEEEEKPQQEKKGWGFGLFGRK
ncbi:signal recognition particle subunit SRP68, partial [Phenoliferia sp. Uapishka_3]